MEPQPKLTATAIGSLPHSDPSLALDIVLGATPEAPIWPQLPKTSFLEQMEIQYSEGLPRAVLNEEKGRMHFDTSGDTSEELAEFYEGYMAAEESGDFSVAAISDDYSRGIPAMLTRLASLGRKLPYVKCQTTGPLSFALTLTDQDKRAIYYNDDFLDVIVKALAMKSRWQISRFKPYAENVICFIDEPILSAFGSSTYVSVQRGDVIARLSEMVEAIHAEGGIAGVHCCGNTEWSILVDAGVDIINFDAFDFGETIALYPEHMRKHLCERHNALAWGIVPTSPKIREQSVESLMNVFEQATDRLAHKSGVDKAVLARQAFITPSCGTGSLDVSDAEMVFKLLGEVSQALKERYHLL